MLVVEVLSKKRFFFSGLMGDKLIFVCVWIFYSEIKERIKKTKDEKKAKKAEVQAKSQKAGGKGNMSKGGASKGPKLGGGGGKR